MMTRTRSFRLALLAGFVLPLSLAAFSLPAHAGDDSARVEKLEKQVRELRAIVFQGRDTGHPVEVKMEGPDPAVTALSQRVDDLEATLRRLQGASETSGHDLDQTRAIVRAERDERVASSQLLSDRVAKLESQVTTLNVPPPPPVEPTAKPHKAPPAPAAKVPVDAPATGSAGDPAAELRTARSILASGDYAGATQAFQAFLQAHPTDPKAPEALYWMGESYYVRDLNGDATTAYARALKGWPKTSWAPDAVVKLARALAATKRNPDACAALGEFSRRYGATATATVKTRADQTRAKLACGE
jgi:tol-pal system protein YbgF